MLDFCVTLPYGFLLLVGGGIGFLASGSTKSLFFGGGFGALLMLIGYLSMKNYQHAKIMQLANQFPKMIHLLFTSAISSAVTAVMTKRYIDTQKVMPALMVAVISFLVTVFYVKKLTHTYFQGYQVFTEETIKTK